MSKSISNDKESQPILDQSYNIHKNDLSDSKAENNNINDESKTEDEYLTESDDLTETDYLTESDDLTESDNLTESESDYYTESEDEAIRCSKCYATHWWSDKNIKCRHCSTLLYWDDPPSPPSSP